MSIEDSGLVDGVFEKAAGDTIRCAMDFGWEPLLINGATIITFSVVSSGSGAPTVTASQLDYPYQISALVSGGTPGQYSLIYTIQLSDPDSSIIQRNAQINVW